MLGLLKKMFGSKPVEAAPEVPYKVEAPAPSVAEQTAASKEKAVAAAKKSTAKKPPAAKTPRKPRVK